jgi:AcrR family transcriptional regulator
MATTVAADEVVAAARRCFARYGVSRATMDDIAAEAGIGRTGLYRLGLSRRDLNDAVILARLREARDTLRPMMDRDVDFAELLVEGSVAAVEWARHDEELQNLLQEGRAASLHRVVVGPDALVFDLVLSVTEGPFRRARAAGQMREDLSDRRAVDWLQNFYLLMLLRTDLDVDETRATARDMMLPAFLSVDYLATVRNERS